MAPQRDIQAKLHILRQALRRESHMRLHHGSLKADYLEGILARGDRSMSTFLLVTHRQGGHWPRAARRLGFDVEQFVCTPLQENVVLPWDFLANERQLHRLQREHHRALDVPVG
jgi:hypothetical protein